MFFLFYFCWFLGKLIKIPFFFSNFYFILKLLFCSCVGMEKNDLYTELWRACAGPLVEVPSRGERVYYFPQGHMEQACLIAKFYVFT